MTKQEYEFSLREITKYQKITCEHEHHDCDHNRCMACINGCYGDVCAFDVVIESIERLKRIEGELRVKVPVERLKSAVQANKELERGENGRE